MSSSTTSPRRVAIASGPARYPAPAEAPYPAGEPYPEFPEPAAGVRPNPLYDGVRRVLADLDLDRARFGSPGWNPLGDLVAPGGRIVIKPNWVLHRNLGPGGMDCMVTHPAVVRAAIDYALLARPREVVVGDAPLQGCDWDALMDYGYRPVLEYFQSRGQPVRFADFRRTLLRERGGLQVVSEDVRPMELFTVVDLGARSLLEPITADAGKFRVTMYDPRLMRAHHQPGRHCYCIAREVLEADLVINLPKLKTHKKAGLTAALKNLVGINGNKEYLPHHRKGSAAAGGDNYESYSLTKIWAEHVLDWANMRRQHPRLVHWMFTLAYTLVKWDVWRGGSDDLEGSWFGNDTVWRMCLDLNRILRYADAAGRFHDQPPRRQISIQDAVIAGQGDGPLKPDPHPMGLILGSLNPAAGDWVAARLLGLDPRRIPIIARAFEAQPLALADFRPEDIELRAGGADLTDAEAARRFARPARPPAGWRGHCELDRSGSENAPVASAPSAAQPFEAA
jgi:uncharacterized protein (DUF362 family)